MSDTIAAVATPPGRGAIAIVRASGPAARFIANRVFSSRRKLRERVATTGQVLDASGARIDQGLALLFLAPRSVTGEDVLELHVHGSPAVSREVLTSVLAAGARLAGPGEFTRRAFLAGKMDLSAAEAVADLIEAEHRSAARAAAARLSGGLAKTVERLRSQLSAVLEELAASIDFPDEVPSPDPPTLEQRLHAVMQELDALARSREHGRLVREGVGVALVGAPNAGKSSLLNALLGSERALVSELAGTTRDTLEETLSLGDVVARVIDTAGIRHVSDGASVVEPPSHALLEAAGIARARAALEQARIALVVVDASVPLSRDADAIIAETRGRERVLFYNKADLGRIAYDARAESERDACLGSVFCDEDVADVKERLRSIAVGSETIDVARPMLAAGWQLDAVLEGRRGVSRALDTLRAGAPVDLTSGDLTTAFQALGMLSGRDASEALLDSIFSRFCIGK